MLLITYQWTSVYTFSYVCWRFSFYILYYIIHIQHTYDWISLEQDSLPFITLLQVIIVRQVMKVNLGRYPPKGKKEKWCCQKFAVHSYCIQIALGTYAIIQQHHSIWCCVLQCRGTLYTYLCLRVHQLPAPYLLRSHPTHLWSGFLLCMCRWAGSWEEEEEGADVKMVRVFYAVVVTVEQFF